MSNTGLTSIPPRIDRLRKLEDLDVTNNQLFYLPSNIFKLTHLKVIRLTNNAFSPTVLQAIKDNFAKLLPNTTVII